MDKEQNIAEGNKPLKNKQHEQLCHEYLIDYNITQAGIRALFSKKTAYSSAQRALKRVEVSARLTYLATQRNKKATKTTDDIERELEKVAFSDPKDILTWDKDGVTLTDSDELDSEHSAAIESIEFTERKLGKDDGDAMLVKTKVKHHNKLRALELLGKNKGMFADKLDINANVAHKVEIVNYGDDNKDNEGTD